MEGEPRCDFEQLYRAHARALLAYALRRVERSEDAVDVLAETMLVAWRRSGDVPPGAEARLWLFGVARLVLANHRRGEQRRSRLGERLREDVARFVGPDLIAAVETNLVVAAALDRLGEEDREILRLTAWEGFSPHEIAVVLAIPAATARTRLHRARGRLRTALAQLGWPDAGAERSPGSGHVAPDERPLVGNAEGER